MLEQSPGARYPPRGCDQRIMSALMRRENSGQLRSVGDKIACFSGQFIANSGSFHAMPRDADGSYAGVIS